MMNALTRQDYDLILQSLAFTEEAFRAYQYPTHEMKQQRIAEAQEVQRKVRQLKKDRRSP